ncbi:MAG: hypothetical protein C0407_16395, partial [Desulfobacca sp.]|nr:hypothetical protein [Desulfobacca sp.]
ILNTLLLNNEITSIPYWIRWLSALGLMAVCFLVFLRINELRAPVWACFILLSISTGSYLLFSRLNIWLAPSLLYFITLFLFVSGYALKLQDAVAAFDRATLTVSPHVRLPRDQENHQQFPKGLKGLLTPRGLYSKARILTGVTNQLIFEKELTDSVIYSDIQGVLLFGPDKTNVLANNLAHRLCRENSLDLSTLDAFQQGVESRLIDKGEPDRLPEQMADQDQPATFTVFLPLPEKKYFKVFTSSLVVAGDRYPLFIFSDITKIKELEMLKGHVVSLVSHEIKTPLTTIEGFSEMLVEALEGEVKELATVIQKESERLIRFLNTFLAISRLEGKGQPLKKEQHLLAELITELTREIEALAKEKDITIETRIPDEPIRVSLDRDLTKQCLINLVENAIKYSLPGKTVLVRLTQNPEYSEAQVIDQGLGIQEKDLGRIFDKFYRATADDRKPIPGSGLGLTFVVEAVEAQGGSVLVESDYGRGSKFSIRFSNENFKAQKVRP